MRCLKKIIKKWNYEESSIAKSSYRSPLINSSTTITFELHMLPWQRSVKHRDTTFCNLWPIFHHLTSFSTIGPRTISYYEIIMKYHPETLYAKYHFVRRVGRHLKIKTKMFRNAGQK